MNALGWESFLGVAPGSPAVPAAAVPARVADVRGLPPTFIGVGSIDLFVDEDVAYAHRLIDAGIPDRTGGRARRVPRIRRDCGADPVGQTVYRRKNRRAVPRICRLIPNPNDANLPPPLQGRGRGWGLSPLADARSIGPTPTPPLKGRGLRVAIIETWYNYQPPPSARNTLT